MDNLLFSSCGLKSIPACILRDFIPANKTFFTFSSFVPSHPQFPFSLSLSSVTSPIFYINILTYFNLFHPQKKKSLSLWYFFSLWMLPYLSPPFRVKLYEGLAVLPSSFPHVPFFHQFIAIYVAKITTNQPVSICLVSQQILILLIISHFSKYFSALF